MDARKVLAIATAQLNQAVKDSLDRRFDIVESLPESGDSNTIYLIYNNETKEHDEYIFVKGKWDKVGDTHIDLSDYVKFEDIISKVDVEEGKSLIEDSEIERLKTLFNYDDSEIRTAVNNLLEEVGELQDSKADLTYVQEEIQKEIDRAILAEDRLENRKQDLLVDGVNIKTFNGQSLLGEGDIEAVTSVYTYVDDLPEQGEEHLIYFTPNTHGTTDEFMFVNNAWHKIGDTDVDLTGYVTTEQLLAVSSNLTSEINARTHSEQGILDAINQEATRAQDEEATLLEVINTETERAVLSETQILALVQDNSDAIDEVSTKSAAIHDFIIEEVYYNEGRGGYRKYNNGMLEQWGTATSNINNYPYEHALHTSFKSTNFVVFITPREQGNFFFYGFPAAVNKYSCRIQNRDSQDMAVQFQWFARGRWK